MQKLRRKIFEFNQKLRITIDQKYRATKACCHLSATVLANPTLSGILTSLVSSRVASREPDVLFCILLTRSACKELFSSLSVCSLLPYLAHIVSSSCPPPTFVRLVALLSRDALADDVWN